MNIKFFTRIAFALIAFIGPALLFANNSDDNNKAALREPGPTKLAEQYQKEAQQFYKKEKYAEALEKYLLALEESEKAQEPEKIAAYILKTGRCYQRLGNYNQALEYYFRYLDLPENIVPSLDKAKGLGYIASAYQTLGNYAKAFEYQFNALQIRENHRDSSGIARSLYEIGTLHFYQENYPLALEDYERALVFSEGLAKKKSIHTCLSAIGSVYEKLGQLETSLSYNKKSLEQAKKLDYPTGIAYAFQNIGTNYKELKNYPQALWNLKMSVSLFIELKDLWGQCGSYKYIGEVYIKTGELPEAIDYLEKGLAIANEIQANSRIVELYDALALALEKTGNYKLSNHYLKAYSTLKDSVLNEKIVVEMSNAKSRYEVQKRDHEIEMLHQLMDKDKKLDKLTNSIYIGVVLFFSFFLGMTYYYYRNQKAKSQLLEKQNKRIELHNKELSEFAFVASHDLKEPIRTIGSFSTLLRRRYGAQLDGPAEEYLGFIIKAVKQMHQLLDDLLVHGKIGRQQSSPEWVESSEMIHLALSNLHRNIEQQQAEVTINDRSLPKIKVNKSQMVRLFQNIIGNGIKFRGNLKPNIELDCRSDDEKHLFSIKDNGIGIAPEFKEKIFDMFSRLHNRQDYEGTGIGLATCKKIVEQYGGKIWVESEEAKGSTFYFTIPTTVSKSHPL